MSVPDELMEILRCIECYSPLDQRASELVCRGCGLHYPVEDGIQPVHTGCQGGQWFVPQSLQIRVVLGNVGRIGGYDVEFPLNNRLKPAALYELDVR